MENAELRRMSGQYFNTYVSLAALCGESLLAEAMELCAFFEGLLSKTVPESDVSRLNSASGAPVRVSAHTAEIIRLALDVFSDSGGLYNIAVCPAVALWRFNDPGRRVPPPDELCAALGKADCGKIRLSGDTVAMPAGMQIDLGGIAKGYIADALGALFCKNGVASALIDLGGNILAVGGRPDGKDWRIGLRSPRIGAESGEIWGALDCRDASVVTSGSYERGFFENGRWYHHILDPRTGLPAENGVRAVSVYSKTSFVADALSTALFLLGPEKGIALAESYGAEAVWCLDTGEIAGSRELLERIRFSK